MGALRAQCRAVTRVRIAYLAAYAALAVLGEALVARPALLWVRGLGIGRAALPWEVALGGWCLLCAALLAVLTLWLASNQALGRSSRTLHALFLLMVGACIGVRAAGGDPKPPRDPTPALFEGLRAAAEELDRDFHGRYLPDAGDLDGALAQVTPPGFRRLGRSVPLHARVLSGAQGPQLEPLAGDQPGTLYVAVSTDRGTAWLSALALHGVLRLASGQPAVIEARQGTHSLPGRDPAVPAYPGARGAPR